MGRKNTPFLSEVQRAELMQGFKTSLSHAFRCRCQTILMKAEGRTSKDVGKIVSMCHVSVNSWLRRYNEEGIEGLLTKPGRGGKSSIHQREDQEAILLAVKANRQRITMAKAEWEAQRAEGDTPLGRDAFRRFLKSLGADTSE
jgi:transposase